MSRRLRYQVAVSLDGFIAGPNGEYDWIVMDPSIDFASLFKEFDTAVMGRKTYEVLTAQGGHGAMPGLDQPAAAAFIDAVGGEPLPKFGWTDVSQFNQLGVPAVNFGPGDPSLAHTRGERVELAALRHCEERMRAWLASGR